MCCSVERGGANATDCVRRPKIPLTVLRSEAGAHFNRTVLTDPLLVLPRGRAEHQAKTPSRRLEVVRRKAERRPVSHGQPSHCVSLSINFAISRIHLSTCSATRRSAFQQVGVELGLTYTMRQEKVNTRQRPQPCSNRARASLRSWSSQHRQ